jgi:hypothetical protein
MKKIALALAFIVAFVCGMAIQGVRDSIATRNWINPDKVSVVENPFWAPSQGQLQEEHQADVAEGVQE